MCNSETSIMSFICRINLNYAVLSSFRSDLTSVSYDLQKV